MELASSIAQRRPALAEKAEPTQQMRIAVQLSRLMQAGEVGVKISEKAARTVAIFLDGARPQGCGKAQNLGFQDFVQRGRSLHGLFSATDKAARRCWTARAYSRQTSCGAICT